MGDNTSSYTGREIHDLFVVFVWTVRTDISNITHQGEVAFYILLSNGGAETKKYSYSTKQSFNRSIGIRVVLTADAFCIFL